MTRQDDTIEIIISGINTAAKLSSPLTVFWLLFAHVFLSCVVKQAAYERGRCQFSALFLSLFFSPLFGFLWLIAAGSNRKVLRERARQKAATAEPAPRSEPSSFA